MPELPEVEVLVRHLAPLLRGRSIRTVRVLREKSIRPSSSTTFAGRLTGARWVSLTRRGKYLVFELVRPGRPGRFHMLGHLGMTGRMHLQPHDAPLPKHAAVVLTLNRHTFVYEDARYFGRLTLDTTPLANLGPEPLGLGFGPARFHAALQRSRRAIKVKLLDQTLLAGLGNIYASEALFRARISPRSLADGLSKGEVVRLCRAIRTVLAQAIRWGSTVPLDWAGHGRHDRLFYYGRSAKATGHSTERLLVYGREGLPCRRCRQPIHSIVQAGRSTYFCPVCQGA